MESHDNMKLQLDTSSKIGKPTMKEISKLCKTSRVKDYTF